VGDLLNVKSADGKTVGIVKIKSLKGTDQAVAILGKGKAKPGQTLEPRKAKKELKAQKRKEHKQETDDRTATESKSAYGVFFGINQTSSDVAINGGTSGLSGTGFSLKGLFDYPLFESIWFRGALGYEQFRAESNDICNNTKCVANIDYLAFDFWGRLMLSQSSRLWLGAGFDLLIPVAKTTTALEESKVTNTSALAVGAGMDYFINKTNYIPVQIEYGMYPKSDTVEASFISVRVGYAGLF
jgi:opacity protein-like surface antigen